MTIDFYSAAGETHIKEHLYNQDAVSFILSGENGIAAALSDGAGASMMSAIGAHVNVQAVMNFFRIHNVESWLTMRDKFLAEDIMFAAANACTDTSNLLRISSEKLSATLLGIAAAGTEAAVFHIGDGAVAVLNNDSSVECLSLPENRDRHNATWFTVDKDAIKHMRITRVDLTNAKALLLMSDGVYQGKEPLDAALELFASLDDFSDFSSIELASVVKKLQLEDDHTIIILRTS